MSKDTKSKMLSRLLKEGDIKLTFYDEYFDEEVIKEVEEEKREKLEEYLAERFFEAYRTDDEWGWDKIVYRYLENKAMRPIMDQVFVDLCGFSLATMIEESYEKLD